MSEFKREDRYLVLKWTDINRYLSYVEQSELGRLIHSIEDSRLQEGKKLNRYVVVNEDESYSEEVWNMVEEGYKSMGKEK